MLAMFAKPALSKAEQAGGPILDASGGKGEVAKYARALASVLGLDNDQTDWLVRMHIAQADSESGSKLNPLAKNPTASERAASRRLFYAERTGGRNADLISDALGFDVSSDERWYTPGSGGWFGLFATNLLNIVSGRDARADGFTHLWIFDKWAATVGYAAYCAALIRRPEWDKSTRDARALKIGGAAGSLMDEIDDDPTNDDKKEKRAKAAVANLDRAIKRQGLGLSFRSARPSIEAIYSGRDWLAVYREGVRRGL